MLPYTAAERLHLVPMNFKSDRTASYSASIPELIGRRKRPLRDTHWLICKLTQINNLLPGTCHALRR